MTSHGPPSRARLVRVAAFLLLVSLAALAWRLGCTNGLVANYYRGTEWTGPTTLVGVESQLPNAVFQHQANAAFGNNPFSATWQGFLFTERPGDYRFSLTSDGSSWLFLDGRLVVNNGGVRGPLGITSSVRLDRGLHRLEVKYVNGGGDRTLELRWAHGAESLATTPASVLFPTRVSYWIQDAWRHSGYVLPLAWALLVLALPIAWSARQLARHLRQHSSEPLTNAALLAVLALTLAISIPGVAWGLPELRGWAPDELVPFEVVDGLRARFSGGWHSPYPPLHYYVLGLLALPFELLSQAGLSDLWHPHTYLALFLLFRAASVIMAAGTVCLAYLCALELHGSRAGAVLSALLVASMPPFLFYAKLANVDVPYLFWFTLSLLYFLRFVKDPGRAGSLIGFGVAATLAVCTKDQAYAFYVLPAVHAIWLRGRWVHASGRPLLTDRGLMGVAAAASLTFVLAQNLIGNFQGFSEHVRQIVGSFTYPPRYDATVAGHASMLADAIRQIGWSMGWPGLLVCAGGVVLAARRRPALTGALALVVASYYLFFIAVIRYHFDRFFLGICVVLALFGGYLLVTLARDGRGALVRRLACAAVVLYGVLHGSYVSVAMVTDSRYHVESWVLSNIPSDRVVGLIGFPEYLPRFPHHATVRLPESWAEVARQKPDVIVINVGFSCRARPDTEAHAFYVRLNDPGNGLYRRALSYRSNPRWPVRGPDDVFRSPCENTITNLGKINPEIRVFVR